MAAKKGIGPCMASCKKATVTFILVSWVFTVAVLLPYANSSTKSLVRILSETRWSEVMPGTDQRLPRPSEVTAGFPQQNSSRESNVLSALHGTKPLSYDETSEQFTPFRYRFNQTYSMDIDVGRDHVTDNTSYLLYRCDDKLFRNCGGWADRLRGIMAGYVIANLTGRVFKWEILDPPCDLQMYLVPNLVNWSLPVPFHTTIVKESIDVDVQKIDFTNSKAFWKNVKNIDFTSLPAMKARYVYYKSNLDYMDGFRDSKFFQAQVSWMKNLTRDQINAIIFKRLFKMSPRLESLMNSFLSRNLSPRDKLVCIHIRTGRNPTLPHDTADRVREGDLPQIWDFLQGISGGEHDKIFLMSDSENVIADAKRQSFGDKLFISGGKIVHVERSHKMSTEERCAGMEKVLLEQFVLLHCDSLVISKSGLSRMPAYVRGSDEELYCLLDKGKVVPCKAKEVKDLYGIMG